MEGIAWLLVCNHSCIYISSLKQKGQLTKVYSTLKNWPSCVSFMPYFKVTFADIVIKVKEHPQHTLKAIVY